MVVGGYRGTSVATPLASVVDDEPTVSTEVFAGAFFENLICSPSPTRCSPGVRFCYVYTVR